MLPSYVILPLIILSILCHLNESAQDAEQAIDKLSDTFESFKEEYMRLERKKISLLQLLVQNTLVNPGEQLYNAARNGETSRVLLLLEAGTSTEYQNSEKNRPIHAATENSHVEILEALLNNGANPNVIGKNNYAPLHWASDKSCRKCAKSLLERGAVVDSRDKWLATPLMRAAISGDPKLVELFLDNKADINAVQASKYSPLHFASRDGRFGAALVLVQRGADLKLKTIDGKTAIDLATQNNHREIIGLLQSKM